MTAEIVLQSVVSGLMFGGVIGLVAVGVSLIWGIMDLINFAYGEYLMWAMYLTFFLWATLGLEPILDLRLRAGEGAGAALAVMVLAAGLRIRGESARVREPGA